ncbi:hypothetical protein [Enterococcus ureilyticus]|uniref:hypothetical protein n=1 Tax=Enterococcus ureilyticus TaxID=1131292 RepID=UPI000C2871CB|nr:hypothetical protein [Enterococcus ureilyticus]MBO0445994.1 hypothetical protein [Enterococcus ureilyticus]
MEVTALNSKRIFSLFWGIVALLISFGILRILTKVSDNDFAGKGTAIYAIVAILYMIITIGLAKYYSKKFAYFLILLLFLSVLSPLLLIFTLNNY